MNTTELLAAVEHMRSHRAGLSRETDRALQTVLDGLDFFKSLAAFHECELSRRDQCHDAGERVTN